MREILLRPLAKRDLNNIWLYIADEDSAATNRQIDRFSEIFTAIVASPRVGVGSSEIAAHLRRFVVDQYVVFYSINDTAVIIERILHSARDIEALFD